MQGQICLARLSGPMSLIPSFLSSPNQPLPSHTDQVSRITLKTNHNTTTAMYQSPVLTLLLQPSRSLVRRETERGQGMPKPPPLLPAAMHPSSAHLEVGGWALTSLRANGSTLPWELRG